MKRSRSDSSGSLQEGSEISFLHYFEKGYIHNGNEDSNWDFIENALNASCPQPKLIRSKELSRKVECDQKALEIYNTLEKIFEYKKMVTKLRLFGRYIFFTIRDIEYRIEITYPNASDIWLIGVLRCVTDPSRIGICGFWSVTPGQYNAFVELSPFRPAIEPNIKHVVKQMFDTIKNLYEMA